MKHLLLTQRQQQHILEALSRLIVDRFFSTKQNVAPNGGRLFTKETDSHRCNDKKGNGFNKRHLAAINTLNYDKYHQK
jgi:hypothetical protein